MTYECHVCGCACDPGELENGVCFDCRTEAARKFDDFRMRTRKSINQLLQERITQQNDGQMAMRV